LEEAELMKKLETLKAEVANKEDELRAKEKYVLAKQEELRLREQGLIEDEITYREKERALEIQERKVKTGIPRFDDLLLGGMPIGSNIMIHGPPFIGKEVMANTFIMEGLRKGIPTIIVLTDKTPKDVRDEMRFIMSGFEEYEKLGLVKYVDTFARAMGVDDDDPHTIYIDRPDDHEKMAEAIEAIAKQFKEKHVYYRMLFRSVSTLIAYSDPNAAFRFLSPMCGRRKKDQAVSFFIVEKGMHSEQELQMLGSIMDGMVDFKVDQLKTFFAIKGISDVQSRAYIRYTATKSALTIGSFALDHIR
jgi:KaiC/GvpD/RAD55 family RecA-like ATPase